MTEKIIHANGVELCTESFGDPKDPALLLIAGAQESMVWWDEELCRRLVAGGRFVIRYDHRDTGRSVGYEPGKPGYDLDDMVEDAVGVLDAYEVERAHLAGISLGGIISQLVAIRHPERVASLTLIASTPHGPEDPDLPPMDEKLLAFFSTMQDPDWSDEAAVVDYMLAGRRLLVGSARRFDEATAREQATREARRAVVARARNHAFIASERWRERLGEISAPTVVIHGTDDPILPLGHGQALAREIPGATLITLAGTGHEIHRDDWDVILNAISGQGR